MKWCMSKRKLLAFLLLLFFFFPNNVQASQSAPQEEIVDEQIDQLDIDEVKQFWDDILTQYGGFLPESQKGSLVDFLKGDKEFSLQEWLNGLVKFLLHEIISNGKLLGTLIMLTVFSVFLQTLQSAFNQQAVSKVAYALVYMVLIIML